MTNYFEKNLLHLSGPNMRQITFYIDVENDLPKWLANSVQKRFKTQQRPFIMNLVLGEMQKQNTWNEAKCRIKWKDVLKRWSRSSCRFKGKKNITQNLGNKSYKFKRILTWYRYWEKRKYYSKNAIKQMVYKASESKGTSKQTILLRKMASKAKNKPIDNLYV